MSNKTENIAPFYVLKTEVCVLQTQVSSVCFPVGHTALSLLVFAGCLMLRFLLILADGEET